MALSNLGQDIVNVTEDFVGLFGKMTEHYPETGLTYLLPSPLMNPTYILCSVLCNISS